jgi:hypothetical protein
MYALRESLGEASLRPSPPHDTTPVKRWILIKKYGNIS